MQLFISASSMMAPHFKYLNKVSGDQKYFFFVDFILMWIECRKNSFVLMFEYVFWVFVPFDT